MRDKLGLFGENKKDKELINNLLRWMESNKADYTNTFCYLMNLKVNDIEIYKDKDFINWLDNWEKRSLMNNGSKVKQLSIMKNTNPIVIPRNHKVEEALTAANEDDLKIMNKLLSTLKKPYDNQKNIEEYQSPSGNKEYKTFCGT